MNNAAIIVFRRSTLPKVLKFFAVPRIYQIIESDNAPDKVSIYIIECPVMKKPKDNRSLAKSLCRVCLDKDISFFIGKNMEYYLGSGLESIENSIERGNIDEIKAIKGLAALIKLSGEKSINLLNKNMCFIGDSHSYQFISTMSEEASGVYIYEHDKMEDTLKESIFKRLMCDKGISAVFSKDLSRMISQCDIVIADNSLELEMYERTLTGKVLMGGNSAIGSFEKIDQVLLWYDSLKDLAENNNLIYFNNELLGILRHFYRERGSIDFIRRFPYIFLSQNSKPNYV